VRITEVSQWGPGDDNLGETSSGKDQFIEIYNASDAPIDISKYIVTTRSLSNALNGNFVKAFIPTGTTLGARQHYVIGFVQNTGKYRAGTRMNVVYPLADYDSGDPETLDAVNVKASGVWPAGQGPGKSSFGMSKGTNFVLLLPAAEANLNKVTSGSWKIEANGMPGNPIVDRITVRPSSLAPAYNANSDGVWPDGNGQYLDTVNNNPAGVGPQMTLRVSSQTLSFQRINEDVDNDRLDDWTVARANPGTSADPVAPGRVVGVTVDGRDVNDPILENVEGGLKLTFPAVGDDGTLPGNLGRANGYVVNYATWAPLNSADLVQWQVGMSTYVDLTPRALFVSGANVQTVSWVPLAPNAVEKHRLSGSALQPGTRYWVVVRAVDDAGNDSGIGLDNFSPLFNPNPVGWVVVNPLKKTPRVLPADFGKSSLFTRPDKTTKLLVKTPGYLADTGNPDSSDANARVDKVTIAAGTLDPETVPTATVVLKKAGTTLSTLTLTVNADGSLPDIVIGDRSTTKVGEEANLADQVDITFPGLPGFTLTRYNDVYPPSKPGDVENTVKPVVDAGAGTLQVYNAHLGTALLERRYQAARLAAWVDDRRVAGPKLLFGDFNEWSRPLATDILAKRLESIDLFPYLKRRRTYPGFFPLLHLDHIYYQGQIEVRQISLPRTRMALMASDHLPLVADLKITF